MANKKNKKGIVKTVCVTLCVALVGGAGIGLTVKHWDSISNFFTGIFRKDDPKPNENTVEVQFKVEGQDPITKTALKEGLLEDVPEDPIKEGFTFKGWVLEGTTKVVNVSECIFFGDTTFVAIFEEIISPEETVQAQFKIEGSDTITKSTVKGELLEDYPEEPIKEGYTFKGWAIEGTTEIIDFATYEFTDNVTFVAIFEEVEAGEYADFVIEGRHIVGYTGTAERLEIDTLDMQESGLAVTGFSADAFAGNTTIKYLRLYNADQSGFSLATCTFAQMEALEELVVEKGFLPGDGFDPDFKLEDMALGTCPNLKSVTIDSSVLGLGYEDTINASVFAGCSNLTSITITGDTYIKMYNPEELMGDNPDLTLYVESTMIDQYMEDEVWSTFLGDASKILPIETEEA